MSYKGNRGFLTGTFSPSSSSSSTSSSSSSSSSSRGNVRGSRGRPARGAAGAALALQTGPDPLDIDPEEIMRAEAEEELYLKDLPVIALPDDGLPQPTEWLCSQQARANSSQMTPQVDGASSSSLPSG